MTEVTGGRIARLLGGDPRTDARALACVWAFGASCLTATIALPHPSEANDAGLIAIAAIAYPVAALMFLRARSLPRVALETMTYLGQFLITLLTFFWGAPEAPFLWFHIWLVVHSFHFLPRRRASLQVVCAAILFVVATVAMRGPFPAATIVVGVGSIVTIGTLVGAFGARVDELLLALERTAASDPLTGLPNRRAFADAYARERSRCARSGCGGALLVLDCDRFKQLNDRHGHAAGDRALRRVARVLSENIRQVDTAARLGGDEFAVLLSAPEPGAAQVVAERIRSAVAGGGDLAAITLSIGIVELPSDASIDPNAAIAQADRAMYRSKAEGGDRVSVGMLFESVDLRADAATAAWP